MGRIFEALERNRHWKVFKHAKTIGDVFQFFGGWVWLSGITAAIGGSAMSYFTAVPIWGKIVLGVFISLAVLVGSLLVRLWFGINPAAVDDIPPSGQSSKFKWLGAVSIPVVVILAAIMSIRPREVIQHQPPPSLGAVVPSGTVPKATSGIPSTQLGTASHKQSAQNAKQPQVEGKIGNDNTTVWSEPQK